MATDDTIEALRDELQRVLHRLCAQAIRDTPGSAAAPAARCCYAVRRFCWNGSIQC